MRDWPRWALRLVGQQRSRKIADMMWLLCFRRAELTKPDGLRIITLTNVR